MIKFSYHYINTELYPGDNVHANGYWRFLTVRYPKLKRMPNACEKVQIELSLLQH